MNKLGSILRLEFLPASTDLALLVLRVWIGASMLLLHGWTKVSGYEALLKRWKDPIGIGNEASLWLAIFGEIACSALLILGLFTRFAALGLAITMAVAFFLVHKMALKGGFSGELAFMYLAGFVAILLAGPGRFALDKKSGGAKRPRSAKDE